MQRKSSGDVWVYGVVCVSSFRQFFSMTWLVLSRSKKNRKSSLDRQRPLAWLFSIDEIGERKTFAISWSIVLHDENKPVSCFDLIDSRVRSDYGRNDVTFTCFTHIMGNAKSTSGIKRIHSCHKKPSEHNTTETPVADDSEQKWHLSERDMTFLCSQTGK